MADEGTFATTAEVQRKIGANANSTANAEAYINQFIVEAENFINVHCRYNFTDNYASLNADVKSLLKMTAASLAAINVLNYDTSGIVSAEAQFRINVLWAQFQEGLKLLKEKPKQNFINNA